jgi:hypothetical protein
MRPVAGWVVVLLALPAWADRTSPPPRRPAPPAAPSCPLRAGWSFAGSYLCAQGDTAVTLRVMEVLGTSVRAEFVFAHAPTRVAGRFTLRGTCVGDEVTLAPEAWVQRPEGYIMVGMRGALSAGATRYEGAMTHASCGAFAVRR